jgi:Reverse transcriptase (RNA-dependent DNA polymerase)
LLRAKSIAHETTIPYHPQQNGQCECYNRTIMERVRAILSDTKLPLPQYGELIHAANFILNNTPTSCHPDSTPYATIINHPPSVNIFLKLRVLGCLAYAKPVESNKLLSRAIPTFMVGYGILQPGYRLWNPVTNDIVISRDVIFDETVTYKQCVTHNPLASPALLIPDQNFAFTTIEMPYGSEFKLNDNTDRESIIEAMQSELNSIYKNETWNEVERTPDLRVLPSRWILAKKLHSDGSLEKIKARFIIRGDKQIHGIDYDELFSPTLHKASLHLVMHLIAVRNMHTIQLDIKTAFLNGKIDREIFVE